jgi:fumarate reductase subunit D
LTAGDEPPGPGKLDLTATEPAGRLPENEPLAVAKPFDPERWHEYVRTGVALAIIAAVIVETLILTIAFVAGGIAASALSAATAAIVTPLVGIAGTVLGFYFGTHRGAGG